MDTAVVTTRPVGRRHSAAWRVAVVALATVAVVLLVAGPPVAVSAELRAAASSALLVGVGVALVAVVVLGRRDRRRHERLLALASAREAVLQERLRLAGEMHDLLSHGLGAIALRVGVARTAAPDDPAAADDALADVDQLTKESIAELRRLLSVLRSGAHVDARPVGSDWADLADLVERWRAHGLAISLSVSGDPTGEDAPGDVRAMVRQVVAEGLANAARYAGPGPVQVQVTRTGDEVVVLVRDSGAAPSWQPSPGTGHGLRLLTERVVLGGGEVRRVDTGRGVDLTARIPVGPPR